jgi:hypothetical protein
MKRWIAHEHDESGWPTDAHVIVTAETSEQAKALMGEAITVRGNQVSPGMNIRIYAIFIEAPRELVDGDPRAEGLTKSHVAVFRGFDEPG